MPRTARNCYQEFVACHQADFNAIQSNKATHPKSSILRTKTFSELWAAIAASELEKAPYYIRDARKGYPVPIPAALGPPVLFPTPAIPRKRKADDVEAIPAGPHSKWPRLTAKESENVEMFINFLGETPEILPEQAEGSDRRWVGRRILGTGRTSVVGLWVLLDREDIILDATVVKKCTVGHRSPAWQLDSQTSTKYVAVEYDIHAAVQGLGCTRHILRLKSGLSEYDEGIHWLGLEPTSGRDYGVWMLKRDTMIRQYEARRNSRHNTEMEKAWHQERLDNLKMIPLVNHELAWYTFGALASAAMAMHLGECPPDLKSTQPVSLQPGWTEVVHLDFKLDNVFLAAGEAPFHNYPRPVIADFGTAFRLTGDPAVDTGPNVRVGTPGNMAPEQEKWAYYENSSLPEYVTQLYGQAVGEWTTVYQIGITMAQIVFADNEQPGVEFRSLTEGDQRYSREEVEKYLDNAQWERRMPIHFRGKRTNTANLFQDDASLMMQANFSSELIDLIRDCLQHNPQRRPKLWDVAQRVAAGMNQYKFPSTGGDPEPYFIKNVAHHEPLYQIGSKDPGLQDLREMADL